MSITVQELVSKVTAETKEAEQAYKRLIIVEKGVEKTAEEMGRAIDEANEKAAAAAKQAAQAHQRAWDNAMRDAEKAGEAHFREQKKIAHDIAREQNRAMRAFVTENNRAYKKMEAEAERSAKKQAAAFRSAFKGLALGAAGLAAGGAILVGGGMFAGAKEVIKTTIAFEGYQARLLTVLKDQNRVNQAMDGLLEYAKRTPFEIGEVTDSYTRLANYGINPTIDRMNALGNLAASNPLKGMDDAVEAVADAMMGEMERIKEFGIRKDQIAAMGRNLVNAKGQIQDFARWEEAIFKLLSQRNIGAMDNMMNTVGGKWSNLKDAITRAAWAIGRELSGSMKFGIDSVTRAIETWINSEGFKNFTEALKGLFTKENIEGFVNSVVTTATKIAEIIDTIYGAIKYVEEHFEKIGKRQQPGLMYMNPPVARGTTPVPTKQQIAGLPPVTMDGFMVSHRSTVKAQPGVPAWKTALAAGKSSGGSWLDMTPRMDSLELMPAHRVGDAFSIPELSNRKNPVSSAMQEKEKDSKKRQSRMRVEAEQILARLETETIEGLQRQYEAEAKRIQMELNEALGDAFTQGEKDAANERAAAQFQEAVQKREDAIEELKKKVTEQSVTFARIAKESKDQAALMMAELMPDSEQKFLKIANIQNRLSDQKYNERINTEGKGNKQVTQTLLNEARAARMKNLAEAQDKIRELDEKTRKAQNEEFDRLQKQAEVLQNITASERDILILKAQQVEASLKEAARVEATDPDRATDLRNSASGMLKDIQKIREDITEKQKKASEEEYANSQKLLDIKLSLTQNEQDRLILMAQQSELAIQEAARIAASDPSRALDLQAQAAGIVETIQKGQTDKVDKDKKAWLDQFRHSIEETERLREKELATTNRLREVLADQSAEYGRLTGKVDRYQEVLASLNLTTKELTADQMQLIKEIARRDQMLEIANDLEGIFLNAFSNIDDGFRGIFSSILAGVDQMLSQMAAKFIASQATDWLMGLAGDLLGGVFRGTPPINGNSQMGPADALAGYFGGARADGGPVLSNRAYLVGEEGPEIFVPKSSGQVIPNDEAKGQRTIIINMSVQAQDVNSFRSSSRQIKEDLRKAVSDF